MTGRWRFPLWLRHRAAVHWDAVAACAVLVVLQPLLSTDWLGGRHLPWMLLLTSVGMLLRARRIAPHRVRGADTPADPVDPAVMKLGCALWPWAVLALASVHRAPAMFSWRVALGVGLPAAVLVLVAVGQTRGQARWRPVRISSWLLGVVCAGACLPVTVVPAVASGASGGTAVGVLVVGTTFAGLALATQDPSAVGQRIRIGDFRRMRHLGQLLVTAAVPTVAAWVLLAPAPDVGWLDAALTAVAVLGWIAVRWPRRAPVARICVWQEVAPSSLPDGADPGAFDPALLDPLRMDLTGISHLWTVPVDGEPEVYDRRRGIVGVEPADAEAEAELPARFLPDPVSGRPQWWEVSLHGVRTAGARLFVFRQQGRDALVEVTAALPEVRLRDGDVLVRLLGGSATAWRLGLGQLVRDRAASRGSPQLADYVEVGP